MEESEKLTIRTGIYVRVSTDDQRDNGYSIDSQLRMIKEYCEKNNYDIIDVYDDGGYSGKDLMRPAMQRLLNVIKEHKLDKKSQRQLLNYLISSIEITRDKNYNIEIKNITFTEQFINKNPKEYIDYLYSILRNNNIGFIYKEQIDESRLTEYEKDYLIISLTKLQSNLYSKEETINYLTQIKNHFFIDGIIERPLTKNNKFIDNILFISKKSI